MEEQFRSICWDFHLKYKILLTHASSTRPDIALDSNICLLDNISAVRVNEQRANISALLTKCTTCTHAQLNALGAYTWPCAVVPAFARVRRRPLFASAVSMTRVGQIIDFL